MTRRTSDVIRQVLTLFGAVFQIAAGAWSGERVGALANALWTPVLPAGYAFLIWTPIFALSLVYAGWQALPANRERPLPRQVGWLIAAAFIGNGLWEILFPAEQFLLAQLVITVIFGCLAGAAFTLVRGAGGGPLAGPERWFLALPLGLFFGWITAAMCVGLAATLRAQGWVTGTEPAVLAGSAILLLAAALAAGVVGRTGAGPRAFVVPYAVAVIWALIAVAVNQRADSPVTAVLALLIALGVLALVLRAWSASPRPAAPVAQQSAIG